MDVSENRGTPKSSILTGFSIIFTIHFGVPLFLEKLICLSAARPVEDCYKDARFDQSFEAWYNFSSY